MSGFAQRECDCRTQTATLREWYRRAFLRTPRRNRLTSYTPCGARFAVRFRTLLLALSEAVGRDRSRAVGHGDVSLTGVWRSRGVSSRSRDLVRWPCHLGHGAFAPPGSAKSTGPARDLAALLMPAPPTLCAYLRVFLHLARLLPRLTAIYILWNASG